MSMNHKIKIEIKPWEFGEVNKYYPDIIHSCTLHFYFSDEEYSHHSCGANEDVLLNLINHLERYLAGEITQNTEIRLFAPWLMGILVLYPCSFFILPSQSIWTFNFKISDWSERSEFDGEIELGNEQLYSMYEQLIKLYRSIDWTTLGKNPMYKFDLPPKEYEWCYSSKQFQAELEQLVIGKKIKGVFVDSNSFADPLHERQNFADYLESSDILILLEDALIDLIICARGLFAVRYYNANELPIPKPEMTFLREGSDSFCEISSIKDTFVLDYKNTDISSVSVIENSWIPWCPTDFDKSKLSNPADPPYALSFKLKNGNALSFAGLDDDFSISMHEQSALRSHYRSHGVVRRWLRTGRGSRIRLSCGLPHRFRLRSCLLPVSETLT